MILILSSCVSGEGEAPQTTNDTKSSTLELSELDKFKNEVSQYFRQSSTEHKTDQNKVDYVIQLGSSYQSFTNYLFSGQEFATEVQDYIQQRYKEISLDGADICHKVINYDDGSYACAGTTKIEGLNKGILLKWSSTHELQWSVATDSTFSGGILDGGSTDNLDLSKSDDFYALERDLDGNLYVTGRTLGVLDKDMNIAHTTGKFDTFVMKVSASGEPLWVTQLGPWFTKGEVETFKKPLDLTKDDYAKDIVVSSQSNSGVYSLYIAGSTEGQIDTDNGTSVPAGSSDAFVMKLLSNDGKIQWATQLAGARCDKLALDDTNNKVYCAGDTQTNFDGDGMGGAKDIIVTSINAAENGNGSIFWRKQLGDKYTGSTQGSGWHPIDTSHDDSATSIAIMNNGKVMIAGHTKGNLDKATQNGGNDKADIFFAIISSGIDPNSGQPAGIVENLTQLGQNFTGGSLDSGNPSNLVLSEDDFCFDLAKFTDSNGNEKFVCAGSTFGNLAPENSNNAGSQDALMISLDHTLQILKTLQLGEGFTGGRFDEPLYPLNLEQQDKMHSLSINGSGQIVGTGTSHGNLDTENEENAGFEDFFLIRLNSLFL